MITICKTSQTIDTMIEYECVGNSVDCRPWAINFTYRLTASFITLGNVIECCGWLALSHTNCSQYEVCHCFQATFKYISVLLYCSQLSKTLIFLNVVDNFMKFVLVPSFAFFKTKLNNLHYFNDLANYSCFACLSKHIIFIYTKRRNIKKLH